MSLHDTTDWWHDRTNQLSLGGWLIENKGFNADELLNFFEKPWNYTDEWDEMNEQEDT